MCDVGSGVGGDVSGWVCGNGVGMRYRGIDSGVLGGGRTGSSGIMIGSVIGGLFGGLVGSSMGG